MAYGLAALSGLLKGLGGLPQGMDQADRMSMEQARLGESARRFDALHALKTAGLDLGMQKDQAEQARRAQLGQSLASQLRQQGTSVGMAPGASVEMPTPGALMRPPAAGPAPAMTAPRMDPKMAALAALVPQLVQLDPAGTAKNVMEQFVTPKPTKPAAPHYVTGADGTVHAVTMGDQGPTAQAVPGVRTAVKDPAEKSVLTGAVKELLASQGIDPLRATPAQIDGAIKAVEARLDRRATLGATVIKPPDSGIIEKGAQQNEVITLGQDLVNRLKANPNVKPGGLARLGEMELPGGFRPSDVIGQTQTDEQRKWVADVTALIGTYRALKSGLAVTKSEAEYSLPIVPMNPGAVTQQQIEALVDWGRRNKMEMDRALAAANKKPLPPTSPPPTPPPAEGPRSIRIRDPKTGRTGTMTLQPGEAVPPGLEVIK